MIYLFVYVCVFSYAFFRHWHKANDELINALQHYELIWEDIKPIQWFIYILGMAYLLFLFVFCVPLALLDIMDYLKQKQP